ncbi:unnamed protein product [Dicrocoelium dendriticum]|nr:unnamed protein product [Dicrocoelium dendriticum]
MSLLLVLGLMNSLLDVGCDFVSISVATDVLPKVHFTNDAPGADAKFDCEIQRSTLDSTSDGSCELYRWFYDPRSKELTCVCTIQDVANISATLLQGNNTSRMIPAIPKENFVECKSHVLRAFSGDTTKITGSIWGPLNKTIIFGHESGALTVLDTRLNQITNQIKPHKGPITDIQMHLHIPMFITASKDHTAKLFSAYDLSSIRTYTTERPINSAAISPTRDHVLLGGGQEAHEVTTTAVGQGKFDARLHHLIYQDEFGRVKGHFGPINSVSFNSDGSGFATGGEEGYVRLHTFDPDYADLD